MSSYAAEARRGRGRVVFVEGEAGIGKTRLLDESVGSSPGVVRRGVAAELGGNLPFAVVVDALGIDLRAARIGRLLLTATGEKDTTWPGDLEFRVGEALLAHIEDQCADGPLTLILEDLQWADSSSLLLLYRLGRRAGQLPLLVVATRRLTPERPAFDRLVAGLPEPQRGRLVLGPLAEGDVQAMARAALGGEPGRGLLDHLAAAAGNPLFVTELIDAIRRSAALSRDAAGNIDVAAGALPGSLGVLVLHRLSFLPAETLDVLRLAALLGASFSVHDICAVLSRSALVVAAHLRPALTAGVLEDAGERLRFRHDVIREALYLDLPGPLRNQLHIEVAQALTAAEAPAEWVAEHLLRGASPENPEVGSALRQVAARLTGRAPGLAADVLARAAELAVDAVERGVILTERTQALWRSGRLAEAEAACRSVLAGRSEPEAWLVLSQILVSQGRMAEAAAAIDEGLAASAVSGYVEARLLAWAAWIRVSMADLTGAEERAWWAEMAAKDCADRFARIIALATRAQVTHLAGSFGEAIEIVREALRLEAEPGHVEHFPLHVVLGTILFDAGRLDEGRAAVGHALTACENRGFRWEVPSCYWLAARGWFLAGRWDDAVAELRAAETLAEDFGIRANTVYGHVISATISLHRGDIPGTRRALAAAERESERLGPYRMDPVVRIRAALAEGSGAPEQALALLREAWERCAGAGMASQFPFLGPDLVRLSLEAGDGAAAEAATAAVEEVEVQAGAAVVGAAALRCRGLVADDPAALAEAASRYLGSGRPLEAAQTSEEAAAVLARQGRALEARALLEGALAHYAGLRATYDSARVEARLRDLGVRRGRHGTRRRPRHGWASLTGTERTVAALVAEGLSNPQIAERLFLSRHTVHTHVSHILAKLDLTSRVELATEALRRSG